MTKNPAQPPPIPSPSVGVSATRRKPAAIFAAVAAYVGLALFVLSLVMIIPAAWLAAGGDRLPAPTNPPHWTILYIVVAIGVAGIVLVAVSLITTVILLLPRRQTTRT